MSDERRFGGRYAVLERVGAGGMAEVYAARDELLDRQVAVKVLSAHLAADPSFVARFRREAQSAANLNHPNIVSLFDYGADNGTYFIVMEYIAGRSVADLLAESGSLLPERAAEIASDVAGALHRAHLAGIVHRDIKPGNIMLTAGGETKVTDFGIARAIAGDDDQSRTQTGVVIGTASYLSPEQAQGNPVDARSDVYALGVVLYEMLTGRPPFEGDSPLAIAYKHVREDPVPPSSLNPDVPAELDSIVMKALAKNPDNRYASAQEMQEDLDRFRAGHSVLATPLLGDETAVVGGTQTLDETAGYEPVVDRQRRRNRGLWYAILALLLLGLVAALAYLAANNFFGSNGGPSGPTKVTVPDVEGLRVEQALNELAKVGLEADVKRRSSAKTEGEVLSQDPAPDTRIREGRTVRLVVSKGLALVSVPDVTGDTRQEAARALERAKLELGEVTEESSDTVPEGEVMSQSPRADFEASRGAAVDIVLSSGPETIEVPAVVGQSEEEARSTLASVGLRAQVDRLPSDQPKGEVTAQDPAAGAAAGVGDIVRLEVSSGPEEQSLPSVTGQPADEAASQLESDLGLVVTQLEETRLCTQPPGAVCRQSPSPGTLVAEGDSVTLYVQPEIARSPEPTPTPTPTPTPSPSPSQ
jgi:eukaryotic-like serine/threonine-protein kinase